MQKQNLGVDDRPIAEIHPYEGNPRRNVDAVHAVAESIALYGWTQPIVVDGDGVILAGHTRYFAARELELATVPVIVRADLDPALAAAYRIADNKLHELSSWDDRLLAEALQELEQMDAITDLSTATGFSVEEIETLIEGLESGNGSGPDPDPGSGREPGSPVISHTIVFDDEGQQSRFFDFMRWLKNEYPDDLTHASRLDSFLGDTMEAN